MRVHIAVVDEVFTHQGIWTKCVTFMDCYFFTLFLPEKRLKTPWNRQSLKVWVLIYRYTSLGIGKMTLRYTNQRISPALQSVTLENTRKNEKSMIHISLFANAEQVILQDYVYYLSRIYCLRQTNLLICQVHKDRLFSKSNSSSCLVGTFWHSEFLNHVY